MRTPMRITTAVAGGGAASADRQHCMPQPAAQGQLVPWFTGCGALCDDDAVHRLKSAAAPATTDSGNSSACSATT